MQWEGSECDATSWAYRVASFYFEQDLQQLYYVILNQQNFLVADLCNKNNRQVFSCNVYQSR